MNDLRKIQERYNAMSNLWQDISKEAILDAQYVGYRPSFWRRLWKRLIFQQKGNRN